MSKDGGIYVAYDNTVFLLSAMNLDGTFDVDTAEFSKAGAYTIKIIGQQGTY